MTHNCVQVWKNGHQTFAHSIHLLHLFVSCFQELKAFLEGVVVTIKLCSIDLFHCLHKKFVILLCRVNENKKNITTFFLNIVLPCESIVWELGRLTTWTWQLLPNNNYVFSWDKSMIFAYLGIPKTFGINWSWDSFAFFHDSKSSFSFYVSCATCACASVQILSLLTLMSLECNWVVTFLSPWNSLIKS